MAWPFVTATTEGSATAAFVSAAQASGLPVQALGVSGAMQLALANLLVGDPSTAQVPAADVLSGIFGANKPGGADTGDYTFPANAVVTKTLNSITALTTPAAYAATTMSAFASTVSGAVVMGFGTTNDVTLKNQAGTNVLGVTANTLNVTLAGALAIAGAFSGATSTTFTLSDSSVTALATPGAYVATTYSAFASTVSGAVIMGFGTTNDTSLFNRAGTSVLGITANTSNVTMAGALAITGALSGVTTLAASGLVTLTAAAQSIAATGTAATALVVFAATGTTTAQQSVTMANTSGGLTLGIESSVGATLLAGTAAYGTVLSTSAANQPLYLGTNNVIRLTIAAAGGATFGGALAITGAFSGATTGAFSGLVTHTNAAQSSAATGTATTAMVVLAGTGTTTAQQSLTLANTSAGLTLGIESSVGATLLAGTAAYGTVLSTSAANQPLYLGTNNVIRLTIAAAGGATFSGALALSAYNAFQINSVYQNAVRAYVSGSNVTTTQQTAQTVTGLSFPIAANETWVCRVHMKIGSSSVAGVNVAVSFPASAVVTADWFGVTLTNGTFAWEQTTASGTLTTTAFDTLGATTAGIGAFVNGEITVANAGNAGTVQIQFAKTTSGTATVYVGSFLTAHRLA